IVVLENIYRHLDRGVPPLQAALDGRGEIGLAAITITLVDVVVYLPLAVLTTGIPRQFVGPFAVVITVATLASLLVSFTLTPLLWPPARSTAATRAPAAGRSPAWAGPGTAASPGSSTATPGCSGARCRAAGS